MEKGNHKIYAEGNCDIYKAWKEKVLYVPPQGYLEIYWPIEGHKETFECDSSRKAYLTIGVNETCICDFIYGVTIYYTDPASDEPILAGNINPKSQLIREATVGYHRTTASARCPQDNLTYYYDPEEAYLPISNYNFILPKFLIKINLQNFS